MKRRTFGSIPRSVILVWVVGIVWGTSAAQVPPEVGRVDFPGPQLLGWSTAAGADFYNVYRGKIAELASGQPGRCHAHPVNDTTLTVRELPEPGAAYFFLVTAESMNGEGTPGFASGGAERPLLGSCARVLQTHVLNRLGYGPDNWSRDRLQMLGPQGYIDEQLDPLAIDESTNDELNDRLLLLEPPNSIVPLIGLRVVKGAYARRQLEQQAASFWTNHFNTDWQKLSQFWVGAFPDCDQSSSPACDPAFPARAYLEATTGQYEEMEDFREFAFYGTFRQMLETSSLSPAMILYLDTFGSVVGNPSENYPRELVELHSMGVDGGYTQDDVEALAKVFTGWSLCKKLSANINDPLAPCVDEYWLADPPGKIVATFVPSNHDCSEKVLFGNTDEMITIPNTCSDPSLGAQDRVMALDAIADHPSTKKFISTKILQRFVTESPTQQQIDTLVAEWDDVSNPQGVGDMGEVLRAAMSLNALLDPDHYGAKIKTPLEHFISAIRVTRGSTDGFTAVIDFLVLAQHIPHYNPIPTGFPELGGAWVDTNNVLTRQNYGLLLAATDTVDPAFGSDVIGLLNDNGVSTGPNNAEAIVDFLIGWFYGGALNPAERSAAIGFLETDSSGVPGPYDDARIRLTAGMLLGYAQFLEQ